MNADPQRNPPAREPAKHVADPSGSRGAAWWICALAAIGTVLFALGHSSANAQGTPPSLVLPATASENARYSLTARRAEPGVARQRPVGIDLRMLDDTPGVAAARIRVDLFDGRSVTLARERLERRGNGDYTWRGKVDGHASGYALLSVVNGQVSGTIDLGDAGPGTRTRYQIQSTNDGLTLLREIDASTFPDDHPPAGDPVAPHAGEKSLRQASPHDKLAADVDSVAKADTASTIDVMVVYSNQTAAAAGTAIGAQIQQAIDTANLVYANSGIATRLRLVHSAPVSYDESGDFPTDLNRLTNAGDGYLDNVQSMRDAYGADLVSLFVENGQYCGYAWIGPSANYAFSVINRSCASGNYSFPHELGHNFGARHDTYVDASSTPYAYGHGWVDVSQAWRDVMAYNNACAAVGVSCRRIPYLSNPNLSYGSPPEALGSTATADVVRVHNQNALTVANFRPSAGSVAASCTYALSPTSASVSQATGSGSIGVTTQAGCAWNAASNATWLSVGTSASGAGSLAYAYGANSGPARAGTISVGGLAFTVSQASGCTYALSPSSASVPAAGASGSITLSTAAGCAWSVSSSAAWLTVSSAASGSGSASVTYVASANSGATRSANLSIGGATFVVTQNAAASSISAASATLSPSAIAFGTVTVGKTSAAKTATIANSGGATLTISSLVMGGANPADFTGGGTCAVNLSLSAGQACTLAVTFAPTDRGTRTAELSIGTTAGSVTLNLGGTGRKNGRK